MNSTVVPWVGRPKSAPISVKASVSEEAANTVMVCSARGGVSAGAGLGGGAGVTGLGDVAAVVGPAGGDREDECGGEGQRTQTPGGGGAGSAHHDTAGREITTSVDFTEATASTPGASFSSSAASLVSTETMRWGPTASSTLATMSLLVNLVTIPVKRLRAVLAPVAGISTAPADDSRKAARSRRR